MKRIFLKKYIYLCVSAYLLGSFYSFQLIYAQQDSLEVINPTDSLAVVDTMLTDTTGTDTVIAHALTNLGSAINSIYDESAPVISPDGKTLFFWSTRPKGYGYQDIYMSKFDESDGFWQPAKNVGSSLNNEHANIVLSITPDGLKLLIYNELSKKRKETGLYSDLAIVKKVYDGWSFPYPLKIDGYENEGASSITAYMLADGKTLIISNVEEGNFGAEDLYISFFQTEKKTWSKPENLGSKINTSGGEITPFIAADGYTMYFSSDKAGGLGGYDIYMTRRLDNTWKNWTVPKNLGSEVNSDGHDLHFKFPAAAEIGYLVSTNAQADTNYGMRDIYSIKIPEEFKPIPVTLVYGKVLDKNTEKPLEAKISYLTLPDGEEAGSANSDPTTGEYKIILPAENNYAVFAEGNGYIAISENLNTRGGTKYKEVQKNLFLVPMEKNAIIRLNNLFFETGKAELHEDSHPELNRLVLLLKKSPTLKIEIGGHTDNTGLPAGNLWLSEERAKSVLKYLLESGIEKERLAVEGYGSEKPVADNTTEEGRQQNRRVEVKIMEM